MRLKTSVYFSRYCLGVCLFGLFIILWGAWVRISHSGDACGESWPSCGGQYFISWLAGAGVWIEWLHRASSGLFGLLVLALFAWTFQFQKKNPIRTVGFLALCLTVTEALIGAGLVLGGLTGGKISFLRILTMHIHLLNSLLLMSSLFVCYRMSMGKVFHLKRLSWTVIGLVLAFFIVAAFGSLSALSASIFPSEALWEGILSDFNSHSHWLVRWRFVHPLLGLLLAGSILYFSNILSDWTANGYQNKAVWFFCTAAVLLTGSLNLLLLSPVFLKLFHLLFVYLFMLSALLLFEKKTA